MGARKDTSSCSGVHQHLHVEELVCEQQQAGGSSIWARGRFRGWNGAGGADGGVRSVAAEAGGGTIRAEARGESIAAEAGGGLVWLEAKEGEAPSPWSSPSAHFRH